MPLAFSLLISLYLLLRSPYLVDLTTPALEQFRTHRAIHHLMRSPIYAIHRAVRPWDMSIRPIACPLDLRVCAESRNLAERKQPIFHSLRKGFQLSQDDVGRGVRVPYLLGPGHAGSALPVG